MVRFKSCSALVFAVHLYLTTVLSLHFPGSTRLCFYWLRLNHIMSSACTELLPTSPSCLVPNPALLYPTLSLPCPILIYPDPVLPSSARCFQTLFSHCSPYYTTPSSTRQCPSSTSTYPALSSPGSALAYPTITCNVICTLLQPWTPGTIRPKFHIRY